jgi:hypothetical protein
MSKIMNYTPITVAALQSFAKKMDKETQLKDGCLTARVVGEFSAGKTRLLKELLKEVIPADLFPVSSIERQTKLQLEMTYGEQAELTVIEREADYSEAKVLKKLTRFPHREDKDCQNYQPEKHRLRLAVPEPRFILPEGDGFSEEKVPMRLFLIDTPGWNSGEDDIAESDASHIMTGNHNLGLVYVTDASRLDGKTNQQRLTNFLEVLQEAYFLNKTHLVFVVTHCPPQEQVKLRKRAENHVLALWKNLGNEEDALTLHVLCVDFEQMDKVQLEQFRQDFWRYLLAPLGEQKTPLDPWVSQIHHWPKEWDIRPKLCEIQDKLQTAKKLLERACIEKEFVKGMNMYRLLGLTEAEIHKRVKEVWLRQVESQNIERITLSFKVYTSLPSEHPLADWWKNYLQSKINELLKPSQDFFIAFEKALSTIKPQTEDLQQHFAERLALPYKEALACFDSSFTRLVDTAQSLSKEIAPEKAIATLLTLSLLESRYTEHYHLAQQGVSA